MKKIIKNSIKCNLCGDVIVSEHRHHYIECSCGACFADGGNDYLRRGYVNSPNDFTELSEFEEVENNL